MKIDAAVMDRFIRYFLPILTYSVIGVINTAIDFTLFSILYLISTIPPWQANVVSYSTAVMFSFLANRRYTFRTESHLRSQTIKQFSRFLVVSLLGLVSSSLITYFLSPYIGAIFAKATAIPVTLCLGYTIARIWVFPTTVASGPAGGVVDTGSVR